MNAADILAFERQWWAHRGSREQAIRDIFGLSVTAYAQRLNRVLDDPASLQIDALTVRRLQRIRDRRAAAISATMTIRP
jgi:hypothetical protein